MILQRKIFISFREMIANNFYERMLLAVTPPSPGPAIAILRGSHYLI
jgi:hypothetical protein